MGKYNACLFTDYFESLIVLFYINKKHKYNSEPHFGFIVSDVHIRQNIKKIVFYNDFNEIFHSRNWGNESRYLRDLVAYEGMRHLCQFTLLQ